MRRTVGEDGKNYRAPRGLRPCHLHAARHQAGGKGPAVEEVRAWPRRRAVARGRWAERLFHFDRFVPFEGPRIAAKLGHSLQAHGHRTLDILFRRNDVAHAQVEHVAGRDLGFGELHDQLDHGLSQVFAHLFDGFARDERRPSPARSSLES